MGGFGGIIMMLKNEYFWGAVAVAGGASVLVSVVDMLE